MLFLVKLHSFSHADLIAPSGEDDIRKSVGDIVLVMNSIAKSISVTLADTVTSLAQPQVDTYGKILAATQQIVHLPVKALKDRANNSNSGMFFYKRVPGLTKHYA